MFTNILPVAQQIIWPYLKQFTDKGFILYGGTAIALQLGNRESIDFDFFSDFYFDPDDLDLLTKFPIEFKINKKNGALNTLEYFIKVSNFNFNNIVKISLFGKPEIRQIYPIVNSDDKIIRMANLSDLFATKLTCILGREEVKDYLDIVALLNAGYDLFNHIQLTASVYHNSLKPNELPIHYRNILLALDYCNKMNIPKEYKDTIFKATQKAYKEL